MIKVIYFATNLQQIIQRGGKRQVLATVINIDIAADKIAELSSETPMNFEIEEVPLSAVKKLFAQSDGGPVLIAMEGGRPVSEDVKAALADIVGKRLRVVNVNAA